MKHTKAIVTLAVGESYVQAWQQTCEANWRSYADKHGFDLICIDHALDSSMRAQKRSPAWQKCLILSQDFARDYERIVWVDSDVLINVVAAPNIDEGVPLDKVGAVEHVDEEISLKRMYEFWGATAIHNPTPQECYTNYGLPSSFDHIVQTGILVLSPVYHRELLEKVYFGYEEKGGREWHMEMRPLSYELLKAGIVHWIDPRFNMLWPTELFKHYPFLVNSSASSTTGSRVWRKLSRFIGRPLAKDLRETCLTNSFLLSFFFHFGGTSLPEMRLVHFQDTWRDLILPFL